MNIAGACPITLLSSAPLRATATFPAGHPAFDGHFPGNPILPGFLQIQMALDALRLAGLPHRLLEVASARFLAPILPGVATVVTLEAVGTHVYAGSLTAGEVTLSRFTIQVA
jgi:3-hydroxymyristoyl/3-hydroxydecanoyl-(acyl carrier protein) dehydratase